MLSEPLNPSRTFPLTADHTLHELFIQNVSHELRTPLSVILGYTQLLREGNFGALAPEQAEAAKVILYGAESLRTVVERVCLLVSVAGQENLFEPVMLEKVVRKSLTKMQTMVGKANLTVAVEVDEETAAVWGDHYRLEHMVDCLIDNAIKFNQRNGRICIQLYTKEANTFLTVQDTGSGIPQEQVKKILSNQFYQVDGSTTRRLGGLGLGITLVKAIVQAHGGTLDIESWKDRGSRFTVKLPTANQMRREPVKAVQKVEQRVLVVDDEENVGLIVQQGLKKLPNYNVKLARSAEQALAFCQESPFDLMITDYRMPGTDGIALALQIREMYPQMVVLMLTAHNDDDLYRQAAQVAVRQILDKPVEIAEIREAVTRALEKGENSEW